MRTELLAYCIEIRRCRSLNRAAGNLFISQPALSAAVTALENELGFKLFHRSHKGMIPTPEGEKVLNDAEPLLATVQSWKNFASIPETPSPVRVVANPVAYNDLLVPAVHDLHLLGVNLDIYVYEARNLSIPSYLEKRRASIGIMLVLPKDKPALLRQAETKRWSVETLINDTFHVFLGERHPLAARDSLLVSELKNLTLALYPEDDDTTAMPMFAQFFSRKRPLRLSNFQHLMTAIADGLAACVFPQKLMRNIPQVASGQVRGVPIADLPLPVEYCLLSLAPEYLNSGDKRVMREIRSRIPDDEENMPRERERERERERVPHISN